MKTAITAIVLAAAAFYAHTGFQTLQRLEVKVEENTNRIEKLECTIDASLCQ